MLLNLHKTSWTDGFHLDPQSEHSAQNAADAKVSKHAAVGANFIPVFDAILHLQKRMVSLAEAYTKSISEELTMAPDQLKTRHVGRQDPKRHLDEAVDSILINNIGAQILSSANSKAI